MQFDFRRRRRRRRILHNNKEEREYEYVFRPETPVLFKKKDDGRRMDPVRATAGG